MGQIAFEQRPYARNVAKVARLAVTLPQAHENADDLGVTLRAEAGVIGKELLTLARLLQVIIQHPRFEFGRNVAPRILHTRTAAEGGGATAVAGSAGTLVFNGLGRPTPVPAGNITFDITAPAAGACAAAGGGGELNCLRVVLSPAGQVRMCNPRFVAAANPQGC